MSCTTTIAVPRRCDAPDGAPDDAISAWLRQDLAARYDAALSEILPNEMLALLSAVH